MGLFGGGIGNTQRAHERASIYPDGRERAAREELRKAEEAYGSAEDRLIKARRAYGIACREYDDFYHPKQPGEQR